MVSPHLHLLLSLLLGCVCDQQQIVPAHNLLQCGPVQLGLTFHSAVLLNSMFAQELGIASDQQQLVSLVAVQQGVLQVDLLRVEVFYDD